jgi:hypothetical protein
VEQNLSIPYRPGTLAYKLQDKTKSRVCIHVLPHTLHLRTLPSCPVGSGAATSHGTEPRLPAGEGSGAATYPMASDLASWLRWALTLPRVLQFLMSRGTKYKERPSWPTYAARLVYFQGTHTCSQGT